MQSETVLVNTFFLSYSLFFSVITYNSLKIFSFWLVSIVVRGRIVIYNHGEGSFRLWHTREGNLSGKRKNITWHNILLWPHRFFLVEESHVSRTKPDLEHKMAAQIIRTLKHQFFVSQQHAICMQWHCPAKIIL